VLIHWFTSFPPGRILYLGRSPPHHHSYGLRWGGGCCPSTVSGLQLNLHPCSLFRQQSFSWRMAPPKSQSPFLLVHPVQELLKGPASLLNFQFKVNNLICPGRSAPSLGTNAPKYQVLGSKHWGGTVRGVPHTLCFPSLFPCPCCSAWLRVYLASSWMALSPHFHLLLELSLSLGHSVILQTQMLLGNGALVGPMELIGFHHWLISLSEKNSLSKAMLCEIPW
jgi:hypothetical protein